MNYNLRSWEKVGRLGGRKGRNYVTIVIVYEILKYKFKDFFN